MTFEQFGRILLKRWGLVFICFLCVGLGAFIGSSRITKPVYQSSTLIEVIVRSGGDPLVNDNILASQQLTQTEATLATTYPILSSVAAKYPGLSADDLAQEVTATARDGTQLMEIDVLDASPTRAANLANSIATTLINQQQHLTQTTQTQTQAAQAAQAQTQAAQTQPQAAQTQPAQNFMVIVQPARPSANPARPNKTIYTGAGLLIGLLLGMVLAVLWELLDPRIQNKEAFSQLLNWPMLGTLKRTPQKEEVLNLAGYNSNTEAYGNLQTHIGLITADKPLYTLAITSATPGDGKSVVAANLAISIAKTNKSVLLIDANLRHPTQHELFSIPAHVKGFSNAIVAFRMLPSSDTSASQQVLPPRAYTVQSSTKSGAGALSLAPFIQTTDIPNLYIMPSGPLPPYPPELLDSKAMQRLLVAVSKSGAEVIIFDTPALLGLADATLVATKVDGTLVVVDTTQASKRQLEEAKLQLEEADVHVLGYVLNKERHDLQKTPYKKYRDEAKKLSSTTLPATATFPNQANAPSQPGLPTLQHLLPGNTSDARTESAGRRNEEQEESNTTPEHILRDKEQTAELPLPGTRGTGE